MKVLIGITQNLEEAQNFITKEYKQSGLCSEVGPFASHEAASDWEQYLTTRAADYDLLSLPSLSPAGDLWYGLTLEWDDVA